MNRGNEGAHRRPNVDLMRAASRLAGLILLAAVLAVSLFTAPSCTDNDAAAPPQERTTSPLCGLPLADAGSATRRALAVKVENHPSARPQSGLDQAEVVYEELVEGGVTRFIALYLDREASEIGPVRSARPMDVDILTYIDPLFAISGGSPEVMQIVKDSPIAYVSEAVDETADYFFRTRDRRAPHNLYTSTSLLREYCAQQGLGTHDWGEDLFSFGDPPEAEACSSMVVGYPGSCSVSYEYDASSGSYLRSMGGAPHVDKSSGKRIAPTTVIIQYVELEDTGVRDMAGDLSPDAVVVGSGEAIVCADGKLYRGTWSKDGPSKRTVFMSEEGGEIIIEPGQVWIHLVPEGIRVVCSGA